MASISHNLTRRGFGVGIAALAATLATGRTVAQSQTRSVTTSLGTYDIPAAPQRVVAIDFRLDTEPALALGLPIVGYAVEEKVPDWIPLPAGATYVGGPPDREAIAALNPDLIVCTDIPESEYWPIDKLGVIAPVLPVDYEMNWQDNLTRMAGWLGQPERAASFIAEYQAQLEAAKAKHAAAIASKLVAAIWFEPESNEVQVLLGEGTSNVTLAGQVLSDLGGRTIAPELLGEFGVISIEKAPEILGSVDAFMLDSDDPERLAALEAHPVWQRLPAIAAGRTIRSPGTFYGGGYSAKHIIPEWDRLYALIS